jgi:peroxiredoxin
MKLRAFLVVGLLTALASGTVVSAINNKVNMLTTSPGATATNVAASVGKPAPTFTLTDSKGKPHNLADLKGKTVVLEWVNYDCPFVKKHYSSKNMQKLQKEYTAKGVVWLSINSSATGKQGSFTAEEINTRMKAEGALPSAYLVDTDGKVGRMYGAKTTPHMFIIDKEGTLVYAGAIDNTPSADPEDVAGAKNLVKVALDEVLAGKTVSTPTSTPYGCSVKY